MLGDLSALRYNSPSSGAEKYNCVRINDGGKSLKADITADLTKYPRNDCCCIGDSQAARAEAAK